MSCYWKLGTPALMQSHLRHIGLIALLTFQNLALAATMDTVPSEVKWYHGRQPNNFYSTPLEACREAVRVGLPFWPTVSNSVYMVGASCFYVSQYSGWGSFYNVVFGRRMCPEVPAGEVPYTADYGGQTCSRPIQARFKIALSDVGAIEPGKTSTFTATVTKDDGSAITELVSVKVSLRVDPTSGGHKHGDNTRPRGGIASAQQCTAYKDCLCPSDETCWEGQTDANGQVAFNFVAPEAAGTHTITVSCEKCTESASKDVDVKVKESDLPGWDTLTASPTEYALIGGGTEKNHHDNHYLTGEARENLQALVDTYNKAYPSGPVLHLNDASLKWGGKFDINGKWKGDHGNHRRGVVIDIRANQDVTAIPLSRFNDFEKYAKQSGAYADLHCAFSGKYICPACLLDSGSNRHYHVRLLGQGIDR